MVPPIPASDDLTVVWVMAAVLLTLVTLVGWVIRSIVVGRLVPRASLEDAHRREKEWKELARLEQARADLYAEGALKAAGALEKLTTAVTRLADNNRTAPVKETS